MRRCIPAFVLFLIAVLSTPALAVTTRGWDGGGDGVNWGSANNWKNNGVPASGENTELSTSGAYLSADVTLNVTAPASGSLNAFTVAPSYANTLTLSSNTITAGAFTCSNTTAWTLAGPGTISAPSTFSGSGGTMQITGGTVTLSGNCIVSANHTFNVANGITLQISGDLTINGGAVLTLNLNSTGTVVVTGTVTKTGGLTFSGTGGTLKIGGTGACFAGAGTLTPASGTIEYNRAGTQTVLADTYNNLTLSGGNFAKSLGAGTTTVAGTLTLTDASTVTLAVGANTLTVSSTTAVGGTATETITVGAGGAFNLSSASVGPALTLNATSTVDYNRGGNQAIKTVTYGNLTTSGGSGTKSLAGTVTVSTALSLGASTTLDLVGNTLNLPASPTITGTGTLSSSSGTGIVDGSGATTVTLQGITLGGAGTTRISDNVTVDTTTVTLGGAVDITGATLTITGVTLNLAGNTLTLPASPTITGTGTLSSASGTGIVDGSGATTVTLRGITLGGAGTTRISDNVTVDTTTVTLGGAVDITGTTLTITGVTLDLVSYTLTLPASPTLTGTGTLSSSSGTGTVDGSGSTTIAVEGIMLGGAGTTSFSDSVTVQTSTVTLAGAVTVAGTTLTVSSTLALGGKTLTMSNGTTRELAGSGTISNGTAGGVLSGAITVKSGAALALTANATTSCDAAWTLTGTLTTGGSNTLTFSSVAANNTLTVGNNVVFTGDLSGAGDVTCSGSPTLELQAGFTNAGTFTRASSTVKYADTDADQTVRAITYNNLELANTNATPNITVSGTVTVAGTLTVSQATEPEGGGTIDCQGAVTFNATYTTNGASPISFKLSGSSAQTIGGTAGTGPTFQDLEFANSSGADPSITYSTTGATLSSTGTLTVSAATILTATSKTIDVDTVVVNQNFTQNDGTFQMDSGDTLTTANTKVVTFGTSATFKTSGATKPAITAASGTQTFRVYGTVNVDGLTFSTGVAAGFELGNGSANPTITMFQNIEFSSIASGGRHLTVKGDDLYAVMRGCKFGAMAGGSKNVEAVDNNTGNGTYVYLTFEDRDDTANGEGRGEANDDDDDIITADGQLSDEVTKGAVVQWLYTANNTLGGTSGSGGVTGIPTRAFGMDTYDFYSTYVVVKDYNGGGAAANDRIYAFTAADDGAGESYYSIDIAGDIIGGIWWDTWDEATAGIPNLNNDGDETDKLHVVLFGTANGRVYVLIDTGTALEAAAVAPWSNVPFNNGDAADLSAVTTMVANDLTNLYFAGLNDASGPTAYKVQITDQTVGACALNAQGNTTLAWDTFATATTLYGGTAVNAGTSYLYRMKADSWGAVDQSRNKDSAAPADDFLADFTGHINISGGYIYAGEAGGYVHSLSQNFTDGEATGYPYQRAASAVGRIAVYSNTAYWGDAAGFAITYDGSTAIPTASALDGAITAAPIYRSSTDKIYIATGNGKLYRLAIGALNLTVDHVYDFGAGIVFTDVARDSDNNRIIVSGYDSVTDKVTFYVVVP